MSSPRGQASRQLPPAPVALQVPRRRWPVVWLAVITVTVVAVIAAEHTSHGQSIVSSIQEFLLKYAGVFALIGMTTAVGVGLLSTDRIVMRPGHRVVAQSVHRGISLGALAALIVHVALEIVAHKVGVLDVIVPFLARFRTLYTGLGTLAADLFGLIVVTGFLRGRFAGKWPWAWRTIHAAAYAAWPLSILHGLLGGRTAKPYVDWSYGACLALVAIALAVRVVATVRTDNEKLAHPVSDRLSVPAEGLIPGSRVTMAPLGPAVPGAGALGPGPARAPRRELSAGPAGRSGLGQAGAAQHFAAQHFAAQHPADGYQADQYQTDEYPSGPYRSAHSPADPYAEAGHTGDAWYRQAPDPEALYPATRYAPPPYAPPPYAPSGDGPPQHPAPRYPQARYSQAEYSQARYSQAQELQRQQRQAQQRQERLLHQEAPAPGWAPEGSDQPESPQWSSDSDMTDPHGWPSTPAAPAPSSAPPSAPAGSYGWPDARDLNDAHGWTDTLGQPGRGGPR
ncbi:MAG TPA: hypothetical protein VFX25_15540 [Streptosporangiaceae bacterium]|nr:hypothetical protein [Streptosporangiaceae bacterium]